MKVLDAARDALDALGLGRRPRLRALVKRAYCRVRDPMGVGRSVPLRAGISVRMPTYFATEAWSDYETVAMGACLSWIRAHPDARFVDVGCSVAIYSLMALQASASAQVVAIDPDRISLKTTEEFCRFADARRLSLVQGFAADRGDTGPGLAERIERTRETLGARGLRSEPTAVRYLSLDAPVAGESVPRFTLDSLLLGGQDGAAPMLLKIDVEGAELLALRGAAELLKRRRPTLLVSVHPQFLPRYGQSTGDVADFLRGHGYGWTLLSSDHEEHWWCLAGQGPLPTAAAAP
jgi:FkbM family methyltransferase